MRWTLQVQTTNALASGRRSRVVLAPRRWCQVPGKLTLLRDDGDKKARSPGRTRRKPLKPSRRECRNGSAYLWWLDSCAFFIRTRGCGCIGHPAFPAPSALRGRSSQSPDANFASREARTHVSISLRGTTRRGNPAPAGLLRRAGRAANPSD
jgi:hypothetical protein